MDRTMEKVVAASIAAPRLTGWLLGVFAALAVLLAGIGIYSVLSYVVSQHSGQGEDRIRAFLMGPIVAPVWRKLHDEPSQAPISHT